MIELNSRDPITMWSDICVGFLSGQENWFDEERGVRWYSYNNLWVMGWDHYAVEKEGMRMARKLGALSKVTLETPQSLDVLTYESTPYGEVQILKMESGKKRVHLYAREISFPLQYLKVVQCLHQIVLREELPVMVPVAIHSTVSYFSRATIPLLYLAFGRRSFLDPQLIQYLNQDIQRLPQILNSQTKTLHKASWKRVVSLLGEENIL